jgi:hypothetical protein
MKVSSLRRLSGRHDGGVPFTCEACGRGVFPGLLPAVGDVLRRPHCGDERLFVRPPLLIVTGTAGIGNPRCALGSQERSPVVVYFSVMLPEQVLVNRDVLGYFDSAHFSCLTCSPEILRAGIAGRDGTGTVTARSEVWVDFNAALVAAAGDIPTAAIVDADRAVDEVESDVRHWINIHLQPDVPIEGPRHATCKTPGIGDPSDSR